MDHDRGNPSFCDHLIATQTGLLEVHANALHPEVARADGEQVINLCSALVIHLNTMFSRFSYDDSCWQPDQPFPNCEPRGNLIIIQDPRYTDRPNDSAFGGCLLFTFETPVELVNLGLLDLEEQGVTVTVRDSPERLLSVTDSAPCLSIFSIFDSHCSTAYNRIEYSSWAVLRSRNGGRQWLLAGQLHNRRV